MNSVEWTNQELVVVLGRGSNEHRWGEHYGPGPEPLIWLAVCCALVLEKTTDLQFVRNDGTKIRVYEGNEKREMKREKIPVGVALG